jgi:uncharacterized membrane-anchored protein YjiN (DUF445 family)
MKTTATGLLILAAVVFVVTRSVEDAASWVAPIRATAEAAMVGALADWFAVTALFRRPLGLPIPHTAIIPANKDRIGRSLGTFVQHNFLAPTSVANRVRDAAVAQRAGAWLAEPANAHRAGATVARVLSGVADVLDDKEASDAIEQALVARAHATEAAPLLARALELALEEGHHRVVIDAVLRTAGDYLDEHRQVLRDRLRTESPWWVPEPIDDRIYEKVVGGAKRFLADLQADPDHELRRSIDDRLRTLVDRLRTDPDLAQRVEERKEALLAQPALQGWVASLWSELKRTLAEAARDPDSELRRRLEAALASAGRSLRDDPELQATVDRWLVGAAREAAEQYGASAADYMAATVERWDAQETSDLLELQVGRDLQFIRINGTVVGGLAGLAIYLIGQLL